MQDSTSGRVRLEQSRRDLNMLGKYEGGDRDTSMHMYSSRHTGRSLDLSLSLTEQAQEEVCFVQ